MRTLFWTFIVAGFVVACGNHSEPSVPQPSLATQCGRGFPPKYQSAFVWGGDSSFKEAIDATSSVIAPRSGRFTLALDVERGHSNPRVLRANPTVLKSVADAIRSEVLGLETSDPAFQRSDYQFTFIITSHGNQNQGKVGKNFNIQGARPEPDELLPGDLSPTHKYSGNDATDEQLREFAGRLPPGIRVRVISEACFGSDTELAFLEGIAAADDRCACGVAAAGLGETSHISNRWMADFVTDLGRKESSLFSANMTAIELRRTQDFISPPNPTSLNLIYRYFLLSGEEYGLFYPYTAESIALRADEILEHARKVGRPLESADQALISANRKRILDTYRKDLPGLTETDLRLAQDLLFAVKSDPYSPRLRKSVPLKYYQDIFSKTYYPGGLWLFVRELQTEYLLQAFLLTAPEETKLRYRDLLACEKDPVLPNRPMIHH